MYPVYSRKYPGLSSVPEQLRTQTPISMFISDPSSPDVRPAHFPHCWVLTESLLCRAFHPTSAATLLHHQPCSSSSMPRVQSFYRDYKPSLGMALAFLDKVKSLAPVTHWALYLTGLIASP